MVKKTLFLFIKYIFFVLFSTLISWIISKLTTSEFDFSIVITATVLFISYHIFKYITSQFKEK